MGNEERQPIICPYDYIKWEDLIFFMLTWLPYIRWWFNGTQVEHINQAQHAWPWGIGESCLITRCCSWTMLYILTPTLVRALNHLEGQRGSQLTHNVNSMGKAKVVEYLGYNHLVPTISNSVSRLTHFKWWLLFSSFER